MENVTADVNGFKFQDAKTKFQINSKHQHPKYGFGISVLVIWYLLGSCFLVLGIFTQQLQPVDRTMQPTVAKNCRASKPSFDTCSELCSKHTGTFVPSGAPSFQVGYPSGSRPSVFEPTGSELRSNPSGFRPYGLQAYGLWTLSKDLGPRLTKTQCTSSQAQPTSIATVTETGFRNLLVKNYLNKLVVREIVRRYTTKS